jgi:protein gp37
LRKSKIDWCDSTFNPVTGCLHGCAYCYARDIARRFGGYWDEASLRKRGADGTLHIISERMTRHTSGKNRNKPVHSVGAPFPYCFDPTFHRYHLGDPQKWKSPRTIFVCSMSDLFGDWVPDEWIEEVFAACEAAPQHRYMFLTKNPARYTKDPLFQLFHRTLCKGNYWWGTTITDMTDVRNVMKLPLYRNCFLSIEPLHGDIFLENMLRTSPIKWIIIGAESGNRKGKIIPRKEWIEHILDVADTERKIPVFMKNSLAPIWGEPLRREFPQEMRP